MSRLRVVADTNVYVSALHFGGVADEIVALGSIGVAPALPVTQPAGVLVVGSKLPSTILPAAAVVPLQSSTRDPKNVDALREAMYNLAGSESLRATLGAAGLARARAFSWRAAAEATLAVYREVLERRPRS